MYIKNLNKRNKFVFQQKEPFWKKIFIIIKLGEFNLIGEKNILKIIILLKLKVFLNNYFHWKKRKFYSNSGKNNASPN